MNFGGIRGKFGEIWEKFREKLGGNSGEIRGKLVNCVSPMVKQNSQTVHIFPTSGKKGENEGKLFHKNSPQGNLCKTGGGNEREFRFHDQFQLHSTVGMIDREILICITIRKKFMQIVFHYF